MKGTAMADQESFQTDPIDAAPPPPAESPRTVWPIVLGAVGLLHALWVLYGDARYLVRLAQGQATSAALATQPAVATDSLVYAHLVIGCVLAVWLLWASIGLMCRKSGPARSIRLWAVCKLIWVGSLGTVILMRAFEAFQQTPATQAAVEAGRTIGAILAVIVWMLPGAALPTFSLIWLSRRKIRSEIAAWERSCIA